MKKFFVFVVAMVTIMSLSVVNAKDIVIEMKGEGQTNFPRSEMPVITASIDDENVCKTNVTEYMGRIAISIENEAGDTLISQTETIIDSTQISTDVSNLEDGNYTITYTLEDSIVFSGEFEKE